MTKKETKNAIPKYSENEVDFMITQAIKPYMEIIRSLKESLDTMNKLHLSLTSNI